MALCEIYRVTSVIDVGGDREEVPASLVEERHPGLVLVVADEVDSAYIGAHDVLALLQERAPDAPAGEYVALLVEQQRLGSSRVVRIEVERVAEFRLVEREPEPVA